MLPLQWSIKPPYGTPLDPLGPLWTGLRGFYALNEGAGPWASDATGTLRLSALAGPTWSQGPHGIGLQSTAAGASVDSGAIPASLQVPLPLSIACAVQLTGTPGSFVPVCEVWAGGSTARAIGLEVVGAAPTLVYCGASNISGGTLATGIGAVISATVTANTASLYLNGALKATSGAANTLTWNSGPYVMLGPAEFGSRVLNALIYWGAWWSRSLSAGEHAILGGSVGAVWPLLFAPPRSIFPLPSGAAPVARPRSPLVVSFARAPLRPPPRKALAAPGGNPAGRPPRPTVAPRILVPTRPRITSLADARSSPTAWPRPPAIIPPTRRRERRPGRVLWTPFPAPPLTNWQWVNGNAVQLAAAGPTTSLADPLWPVTAGDLIVVAISAFHGGTISGVADSTGANTYQLAASFVGTGNAWVYLYYSIVAAGGAGITVTASGAGLFPSMAVEEFSAPGTIHFGTAAAAGNATSTAPNSGAATPVTSDNLLYGAVGWNTNAGTPAAGTGFLLSQAEPWVNTKADGLATEYWLDETGAAAAATFGLANSVPWACAVANFYYSGASPTIVPRSPFLARRPIGPARPHRARIVSSPGGNPTAPARPQVFRLPPRSLPGTAAALARSPYVTAVAHGPMPRSLVVRLTPGRGRPTVAQLLTALRVPGTPTPTATTFYMDPYAAMLAAAPLDPTAIDPYSAAIASADSDPFAVDPYSAVLVEAGDADRFALDPYSAT